MTQTLKYRPEEQHLIENYDKAKADNFKGWICHHRLALTLDGEQVHDVKSLERLGMYWNRPYYELIYVTRHEHWLLHHCGVNSHMKNGNWLDMSEDEKEDRKRRQREHSKGHKNPDSMRKALSALRKADNAERFKNKKWYNNGVVNVRSDVCPPGFVAGRTFQHRNYKK